MKKILLIAYIVLSTSTLFATIDSTKVITGINTTAEAVTGIVSIVAPQYSALIVVVFGAVSSIFSLTFAFLHRKATLKKWKEQGKINE
jgi:hypothetical protein